MKALRVHHVHQHQRHGQTQCQPCDGAQCRPGGALKGHNRQDLASCQSQMSQQAKFLAPCQHLGAEARRDAKQANADGHRLQPVRDGEAAIEDPQRGGAYLSRRTKFKQRAGTRISSIRQLAQRLLHYLHFSFFVQPKRYVIGASVAAELFENSFVDCNGAALVRIVAPDASNEEAVAK